MNGTTILHNDNGTHTATVPAYRFDRRVSPDLISALGEGGWLHPLLLRRQHDPFALDLQFGRTPDGARSWLSVHPGWSSVLDVDLMDGAWRLRTHPSYQAAADFDPAWTAWQSAGALSAQWTAVDHYLDTILADERLLAPSTQQPGRLHTLMCAGASRDYRIIQRHAVISFVNQETMQVTVGGFRQRILAAIGSAGATEKWWPGIADHGEPPGMGIEVDLLGVDPLGRLLVFDVNAADAVKAITFAPARATLHAQLFAALLRTNSAAEPDLDTMLAQRTALGLTADGEDLHPPVRVVPIVALGPGMVSPNARRRLAAVNAALEVLNLDNRIDPLEVWLLDNAGRIDHRWIPGTDPSTRPAPEAAPTGTWSFREGAREGAARWKQRTSTFPEFARQPDTYRGLPGRALHDYCFPVQLADLNLLPDARATALDRFGAAGITWYQGTNGMPSNDLLSSQVQCANALAPLVKRPQALEQVFGSVLPIAEILPFGAVTDDPHTLDDHVVFGWIGLEDHLDEGHRGRKRRGAHQTSADAAIRYRTPDGHVEVALIEWSYQEQYLSDPQSGGPAARAADMDRYRRIWDDPGGPLRHDLIPYEDLFVEPFYQLMRLQMLAWRMERGAELAARAVRVVWVAPSANAQLAQSWSPTPQRLADRPAITPPATIWEAWKQMPTESDRFGFLDSATLLLSGSPMSGEWKDRHGHLAGSWDAGRAVAAPTPGAGHALRP